VQNIDLLNISFHRPMLQASCENNCLLCLLFSVELSIRYANFKMLLFAVHGTLVALQFRKLHLQKSVVSAIKCMKTSRYIFMFIKRIYVFPLLFLSFKLLIGEACGLHNRTNKHEALKTGTCNFDMYLLQGGKLYSSCVHRTSSQCIGSGVTPRWIQSFWSREQILLKLENINQIRNSNISKHKRNSF